MNKLDDFSVDDMTEEDTQWQRPWRWRRGRFDRNDPAMTDLAARYHVLYE